MPGIIQCLASFPNSRIRPRKPTASAITRGRTLEPAGTLGPVNPAVTEPVEADEDSQTVNGNTVINARNLNRTYITIRNVDPSDAMAYGYEDTIDLALDGMILRAGDSVDLESPQTIYGISLGIASINIRFDRGIG